MSPPPGNLLPYSKAVTVNATSVLSQNIASLQHFPKYFPKNMSPGRCYNMEHETAVHKESVFCGTYFERRYFTPVQQLPNSFQFLIENSQERTDLSEE